jgi:hexulose-6-phosphate isomerase
MPTPHPPAEPYRSNAPHPAPLGVMQGRLVPPDQGRFQSFPRSRWRDEFPRAVAAGIDYIEWIVDEYGLDMNPILTEAGRAELDDLKARFGVQTLSICADWFMANPLLRCSAAERAEREKFLHSLIPVARRINAHHIVLPFVDSARIITEKERTAVAEIMLAAAPLAADHGIGLHLETDLAPAAFAALLDLIAHPFVKAHFDTGNSAGLGYVASKELAAYGHRVGSIHIKDRYRKPEGGIESRALGTGSTDFDDAFAAIKRIGYSGPFTLEVARGEPGNEVGWIQQQLAFIRRYWP